MATYELSSSSSSIIKDIKNCLTQKLIWAAEKKRKIIYTLLSHMGKLHFGLPLVKRLVCPAIST
jgi:hypothetical protein